MDRKILFFSFVYLFLLIVIINFSNAETELLPLSTGYVYEGLRDSYVVDDYLCMLEMPNGKVQRCVPYIIFDIPTSIKNAKLDFELKGDYEMQAGFSIYNLKELEKNSLAYSWSEIIPYVDYQQTSISVSSPKGRIKVDVSPIFSTGRNVFVLIPIVSEKSYSLELINPVLLLSEEDSCKIEQPFLLSKKISPGLPLIIVAKAEGCAGKSAKISLYQDSFFGKSLLFENEAIFGVKEISVAMETFDVKLNSQEVFAVLEYHNKEYKGAKERLIYSDSKETFSKKGLFNIVGAAIAVSTSDYPKSVELCNKLEGQSERDQCLFYLSKESARPEICTSIADSNIKSDCIFLTSMSSSTYNGCEELPDELLKVSCYSLYFLDEIGKKLNGDEKLLKTQVIIGKPESQKKGGADSTTMLLIVVIVAALAISIYINRRQE